MHYVVGIDEVGRGSLAGPVVVAALAVPQNFQFSRLRQARLPDGQGFGGQAIHNFQTKLKDSKKLTPKQRERWFEYFKNHPRIDYAIARVYPRQIEKTNISRAANLAALRAFRRLHFSCRLSLVACRTFLDGGLYLGNGAQPRFAKTIVRGDEKVKAVAAASIVAKVSRDRIMVRLAKKYPRYGFETHKGYGTKAHFAAIKKHGPSSVHRLTFL